MVKTTPNIHSRVVGAVDCPWYASTAFDTPNIDITVIEQAVGSEQIFDWCPYLGRFLGQVPVRSHSECWETIKTNIKQAINNLTSRKRQSWVPDGLARPVPSATRYCDLQGEYQMRRRCVEGV
jgi:hypothetical protein